MSSPNANTMSDQKSDHSPPHRRHSYSRDRGDKRRERRDHDSDRRRSRSRERHRGDRRSHSRSRDRSRHRDRDRDRDRERDRDRDRDRDRGRDRRRDRDDRDNRHRERDDRERRRRKRDDDSDHPEDDRHKRRREEGDQDVNASHTNGDSMSVDRNVRRDRSRDSDRRHSERHPRRRSPDSHGGTPTSRRDDRDRPHRRDEDGPGSPPKPKSPPAARRPSPQYEPPPDSGDEQPNEDHDSEARSVFVSQLAARLTARDLGYFFEDKLGEDTVKDARIVTDRISRRSKGIGYIEFKSIDLVPRAIALSGTIVMGLPIMVQLTEAERNRTHAGDGITLGTGGGSSNGRQIYVGSLHFNLTESDIKQVFEPFGDLDFVDLHRDPMTGRSKGYCFIQYKRAEDAKMALEQMEGFELAGRSLRVKTVHEKGSSRSQQQDILDEGVGGNLNAASRQALMQKLARTENAPLKLPEVVKPVITQQQTSRCVLLKNMFNPDEETERDWDKDLAEDVKGECEQKYGKVERIKVEKESQGEIYVKFDVVDSATKAIKSLNGRWFGGRQVAAHYISDAIMQAHQ